MPPYRSHTRKYPQGAQPVFQPFYKPAEITQYSYTQPHSDACAGLAHSVSKLSLDEASTVSKSGVLSDGDLGDLMSSMSLAMQLQPSPLMHTFSPRLNRPYPNREYQNSHRAARKCTAMEHRPTSPTTHVLRGPGQGLDPYAALRDYIDQECAALVHRSNPQKRIHNVLQGHGIDAEAALRDYAAAAEPRPLPNPTLPNSPPGLHSMPDRRSQLSATIKQLGHRLARTTLGDTELRTQATNSSADAASHDEEMHNVWVPSWASSSEDTGSDCSISDEEL